MWRLFIALCLAVIPFLAGCSTTGSDKPMEVQTLTNDEFRKLDCAAASVTPEGMEPPPPPAPPPAPAVTETNAVGEAASTNVTETAALPKAKSPLIGPGAQVTVYVTEDSSLNRQYIIPPSGVIEFPPLGRFTVSGLTAEELAAKLKEGLEKDYFKQATVEVTVEREAVNAVGVIYVLGRVGRAGPIALPQNEAFTLTKAILAAGGGDVFANLAKVQIIRYCADGKKYRTYVNVERIMERGEFENDVPLRDGDWVLVPEKMINLW